MLSPEFNKNNVFLNNWYMLSFFATSENMRLNLLCITLLFIQPDSQLVGNALRTSSNIDPILSYEFKILSSLGQIDICHIVLFPYLRHSWVDYMPSCQDQLLIAYKMTDLYLMVRSSFRSTHQCVWLLWHYTDQDSRRQTSSTTFNFF